MIKKSYKASKVSTLTPLRDNVLVRDMNFEYRVTTAGIILPSDDGKDSGIRPRWGKVYAIGPEQTEVKVGQWILMAHGRWTRGIEVEDSTGTFTIRKVDLNDILAISDDETIIDDTMGVKV